MKNYSNIGPSKLLKKKNEREREREHHLINQKEISYEEKHDRCGPCCIDTQLFFLVLPIMNNILTQ